MNRSVITAACIASLAVSGCSTKPRNFSATVRPAADASLASQSESELFVTCDTLVRAGHTGNFASAAASAGAGMAAAAATTGTVVLNGAVAPGFMAVSTAAAAAVPVIGILASIGTSRMIRGGRERSYRRNMSACFADNGYDVIDWQRMKKKQVATAHLAEPAAQAGEPALPAEAATTEPPAPDATIAYDGV